MFSGGSASSAGRGPRARSRACRWRSPAGAAHAGDRRGRRRPRSRSRSRSAPRGPRVSDENRVDAGARSRHRWRRRPPAPASGSFCSLRYGGATAIGSAGARNGPLGRRARRGGDVDRGRRVDQIARARFRPNAYRVGCPGCRRRSRRSAARRRVRARATCSSVRPRTAGNWPAAGARRRAGRLATVVETGSRRADRAGRRGRRGRRRAQRPLGPGQRRLRSTSEWPRTRIRRATSAAASASTAFRRLIAQAELAGLNHAVQPPASLADAAVVAEQAVREALEQRLVDEPSPCRSRDPRRPADRRTRAAAAGRPRVLQSNGRGRGRLAETLAADAADDEKLGQ